MLLSFNILENVELLLHFLTLVLTLFSLLKKKKRLMKTLCLKNVLILRNGKALIILWQACNLISTLMTAFTVALLLPSLDRS